MISSSSSQLRNWTFSDLKEVNRLREEANAAAKERFRQRTGCDPQAVDAKCLTVDEEVALLLHYERILEQLCTKTEPAVPQHTRAVAVAYLRRFYLHHSVIDFFPREVMLTATWLAMKTEEFNLSLAEFVRCIPRNASKYMEIIRNSELFLLESLNFDLLIHVPTRAVDGLVAEFLAFAGASTSLDPSVERACAAAGELAYRSMHTDALFVCTPPQIALAALRLAVDRSEDAALRDQLDRFVLERLCGGRVDVRGQLSARCAQASELLRSEAVATPALTIEKVEAKLEQCRNPEYNFDSAEYKTKKQQWEDRFSQL